MKAIFSSFAGCGNNLQAFAAASKDRSFTAGVTPRGAIKATANIRTRKKDQILDDS